MIVFHMIANRNARRKSSPYETRNHNLPRPYLARLSAHIDGIAREFLDRTGRSSTKGLEWWSAPLRAGNAIEARTWIWNDERKRYVGGTAWLIHDGSAVAVVDREQAFSFVLSGARLAGPNGDMLPALRPAAERLLPPGMSIFNEAARHVQPALATGVTDVAEA